MIWSDPRNWTEPNFHVCRYRYKTGNWKPITSYYYRTPDLVALKRLITVLNNIECPWFLFSQDLCKIFRQFVVRLVGGGQLETWSVCATGALAIPATELKDTEMFFCINTSEPVRDFRNVLRDTALRDFITLFKKPSDSLSASFLGVATRDLITFLAVGLLSKHNFLIPSTLLKLICSLRILSTGAQHSAMYRGFWMISWWASSINITLMFWGVGFLKHL